MPRDAPCTQWAAVIPKSSPGAVNVPKCPVLVSPGPDGTGGVPERAPGRNGYLGFRPDDSQG